MQWRINRSVSLVCDWQWYYPVPSNIPTLLKCPSVSTRHPCKCTKWGIVLYVPSGNYSKLVSAINQQPVAVAVSSVGFKLYNDGVFDGNCTQSIDTGVHKTLYRCLYSVMEPPTKVSSIGGSKVPWGKDWGINGTMLLARDEKDGPGKCGGTTIRNGTKRFHLKICQ